ncbi:MAG: hypothetical protein U5M23_03250 [Marinagarivorans sp.]|nr:hypothetical protein [Marinagarivorans sp.]
MLKTLFFALVYLTASQASMAYAAPVVEPTTQNHSFRQDNSIRQDYGNNRHPIWSPLSSFEEQTLSERFDAQEGDPDALLALFLMASGHYQQQDFGLAQKAINNFTQALERQSIHKVKPKEQGRIINSAMHSAFFAEPQNITEQNNDGSATATYAPSGRYKAEQSALAGIFIHRDFNCISSSLLYAVLIRKMGLKGLGVTLPSHAFIELNLAGGDNIDVETTSPQGYDQAHDIAFYHQDNNDWATARGLTPVTYTDYLHRERIPLWQLGTRNMLHQHTHPGKMSELDRGRLAELSAFLDPSYETAQVNRMSYYTQEVQLMLQQQRWGDLKRFINTTFDNLAQDTPRFSHNNALQNSFFWLHLVAIRTFAALTDADSSLDFTQTSYRLADTKEQLEEVKNNSLDALNTLLKDAVKKHDFQQGLYLLTAFEPFTNDHANYPDSVQRLYSQWAEFYWKTQEWSESVSILEDYLLQPYLSENSQDMQKNLASAYSNWVGAELTLSKGLMDSHSQTANAIIEQCEAQHLEQPTCNEARKKMQAYRLKNSQSP